MKIFNLPIPFTEPSRKDQEIENLKKELLEKDLVLGRERVYIDQLFDEKLRSKDQEAILEGQLRLVRERTREFEEQNASYREEKEMYRAAFNAIASGSDQFPGQERMLELARQATQIMRDSGQSCSLSYELYAVQICNEADRIIPKLTEKEARFFQALLGGDYTPPNKRGNDWQSEYEIRQELYREMYGEEEPYENDKGGKEEEAAKAIEVEQGVQQFLNIMNREYENLKRGYSDTDEDSYRTRGEYRDALALLGQLREKVERGETSINLADDWSSYDDNPLSEYQEAMEQKESALLRIRDVLEKGKDLGFNITHEQK